MKKMTSQRGFTLIEMAIVLVIIGVILGAVLKGQDLIDTAREKKVINWVKSWEMSIWQYMDRKGRLPGDSGRNGLIGDQTTERDANNNPLAEIANARFASPPSPTMSFGSTTFYIKIGSATEGTPPIARNVIILSVDRAPDACGSTPLQESEIHFFESFDTAIDGDANPMAGSVRGFNSCSLIGGNNTVTGLGTMAAQATWTANEHILVYYFDRPR